MSVTVEPTLPFSPSTLALSDASRWSSLLPLLRPSLKPIRTPKGPHILIDTALAHDRHVHIAAQSRSAHLSTAILDAQHHRSLTAIVPAQKGAGVLTAEDVRHAMRSSAGGVGGEQGVLVVRAGSERKVNVLGPDLVEVETEGLFEMDCVLLLLASATESARTSIHHSAELLRGFVREAKVASGVFHTEKDGQGKPAVVLESGVLGYQNAREVVQKVVGGLLEKLGPRQGDAVYSVHYSDVNGLSRLENYILAKEIAEVLESANIPYHLSHSTVLDHDAPPRGFSIAICPIPSLYLAAQRTPLPYQPPTTSSSSALKDALAPGKAKMTFNDAAVRKRIEAGCNAVIAAEPTITEYDTIVGDGDCGYTLRDGATQVLSFIADKDLSRLPETVSALVEDLEVNMGGTSGALYCIYLTALAGALATQPSVPLALQAALRQLMKYTNARLGDRTMMDALIPFVETLAEDPTKVKEALANAKDGVEWTKNLEAKLGRSTYLDESATQGVPDPGAYGLYILLNGMAGGEE